MESKNEGRKDYYASKALWFGITCIACALYFFAPILFTPQKSLIKINGDLETVDTSYGQVSSGRHKSVKSALNIVLENNTTRFRLTKNIEQSWYNEKFESIKRELKQSGSAIIWIKENDQLNLEPTIFQIATGEMEMLYDMNDAKSELKFLFPFLLVLGCFGIGLYLYHNHPNQVKSIISKKTIRNNK